MALVNNQSSVTNQARGDVNIDNQHNQYNYYTNSVDEINQDCLGALKCPNSLKVKTQLQYTKGELLYESIKWISQDPQYKRWRNGDNLGLLWIKGSAGKGKTMISIGLIEQELKPRNSATLLTYFFCKNADSELNTTNAIIKGLILRILDQQEELYEILRRRWNSAHRQFEEDITCWRTLWDIFWGMLDRCRCRRVYIVIDALDECQDEGVNGLLELIVYTGLHQPSKIKWLLTSRPFDSAERVLRPGANQALISLEHNSKHTSKAIKTYITFQVAELDRFQRYGPKLRQKIETRLKDYARGNYLWVHLACKRLKNVPRDKTLETIQNLPLNLNAFYHDILYQLSHGERVIAEKCMRLLKVMLLSYRPLDLFEMNSLMGFSSQEVAIETLVEQCASIVKMGGNIIEFVHQSAREYLLDENGRLKLDCIDNYGHSDITLSCVKHLSKRLKANLVDLPRPDSTRESVKELKDEGKIGVLSSIGYAATFWAQHLKLAERALRIQNALSGPGEISQFLQTKLLEWLECLSLLDQLPSAVEAFKVLSSAGDSSKQPSISMFIQDATRFLLRNYHTIKTWPLQTYSSAIIFSPQISMVRTNNVDKIPRWLKKTPLVEREWASLIQTLAGHSRTVQAVAFSPNGKRIVSGSVDKTIKVWDAVTGDPEKTLAGHSNWVTAVVFSPDGKWIASGSYDETIKVWDAATGDLEKTLAGHSDGVVRVVFSRDGKWIVSGSSNNTIKVWNAVTGELEKTLTGNVMMARVVAFSPDGKWIVSVSHDETIKVWDTITGDPEKTLASHSDTVTAVVFSPDGKQIALGFYENTIEVWDTTTGKPKKTLTGHSDWIRAVAFSPDGKWIASGSGDKTIKVWDTITGDPEKTLADHTGVVTAVRFSPDGKWIVSGSFDKTIKVWDAVTGGPEKTLAGHSDTVAAVVFSPDSKWIASGSYDKTIKVWDAATGDLEKTLTGHSDGVTRVVFSRDGKWIVSGSNQCTIKVWNAVTGDPEKTLALGSKWVEAVAFSPDGKWIASKSGDKTAKVWDAVIDNLEKTLVGYTPWVTASAFSLDGKRIASVSDNTTIKVWDAVTGDPEKTLAGHSDLVTAVVFSPDSKRIASGSDDTIKVWDTATGDPEKTLAGHSGRVSCVVFSPDSKQIASFASWFNTDKTIKIWDAATGDLEKTLTGHLNWVQDVAFSPDGKQIVSGSTDKTIKVWDTITGKLEKTLAGHTGEVRAVTFSLDGKRIVSGSVDETVKVWDTITGDPEKTLAGHSDTVTAVVFSPDSKRIASGSYDKTIKVWDAATGDLEKTLAGHSGFIRAVAFSLDGKWIASGSNDKTIKLWNVGKSLEASRLLGKSMTKRFKSQVRHEIAVSKVVYKLRFSVDGQHLLTNIGPILLKSILTPKKKDNSESSHYLYVSDQWLCYEAVPILRLQPDAESTCYDTKNDQITIGFKNGRVMSFDIDRPRLHSTLGFS